MNTSGFVKAPTRKPWLRWLTLVTVLLVPLTFAGLFVGAISDGESAADRVPAALVNEDELIYQTSADGTETPVFAGRQLVTELTADDSFDWTITNSEAADRALAAGEVHAILTIPEGFSSSILSLSGDDPTKAELALRTDDSHSYLTGAVSEVVGNGMANAFGNAVTAQYLAAMQAGLGELGRALSTAADGAGELSNGAGELSTGLSELSTGVASAQGGAASLASGVSTYTRGVERLTSGLGALNSGAASLDGISSGVSQYASGVAGLQGLVAQVQADPGNTVAVEQLAGAVAQLSTGGQQLSQQVSGGVSGIQGAIAQSTAGAQKLAAGSGSLRSGASSVAGGLSGLTSGASSAASGADALADGAEELATGLQSGADQVPASDAATADIVADPVSLTVSRDNEISDDGQAVAAFFVPLGLWIGALAIFLVLRPLTRRVLESTATTGRLLVSALGKASLLSVGQALLLVALLHITVGVSWVLLPITLGFALMTAAAFTAFHYLLVAWLGRLGLVVSLLAIAIQVTAAGGLYPIELLAVPFQLVSPLLPLTYAVSGMQAIFAGGNAAAVSGSAMVLLGFGSASALLSWQAIQRARRSSALGLAVATE